MHDFPDSPQLPARRRLLTGIGALGLVAGGGVLLPAARAEAADWQNWSGGQKASPQNLAYPTSEEEIATLVRQAPGNVRAFGGSHSFTPVAASQGTMISLEAMNGIVRHDPSALTATIMAGTRIANLGTELKALGQGLINEADINYQSLAGAISTATHGTGRQLQCYSAYVREMRLILADGSIVQCSKDKDRELFEAARVGVGSVGIISQITLQNRAAYRLREVVQVMELKEAMALVNAERDKHRHIEFFAFLYGDRAVVKRTNLTSEAITPLEKPAGDDNEILEWAADTARKYPWTNSWIQRAIGLFVSNSSRVGESYDLLASPRTVQFNEMEYTLPADQGLACLQEVRETIRKKGINVFFPIEFRYTAADDCWLSPFYGQASASISVHQYHKQEYRELFNLVEPIFWKYKARPHWGKLHTLKARNFRALYPQFDAFQRVRAHADPQGKFLSPYAKELFVG